MTMLPFLSVHVYLLSIPCDQAPMLNILAPSDTEVIKHDGLVRSKTFPVTYPCLDPQDSR